MKTLKYFVLLALLGLFHDSFAQPANDNCADAQPLVLGSECTFVSYTSIGATSEPGIAPNPTCGLYQGGDVWFSFEVPASGSFRIQMSSAGTNSQWALYEGACGDFTQLRCATSPAQMTSAFSEPALAGETVYLRAWRFNSTAGIDFDLCVWETVPPLNDNCADALSLTVGETCDVQNFSSQFSSDEPGIAPNPTCGLYQGGDVWFSFEVPTSGNFRIEMSSAGTNSQWALYNGACGSFTQMYCATSSVQMNANFSEPALAGETLYIRSWRFNSGLGIDFSLCVHEIDMAANDNCADAINVTVGETCNFQNFSSQFSTSEATSVAPNPTCGIFQGGDVWFTFEVPASGNFRVVMSSAGNNASWALYSGSCGSFSQLICASNTNDLSQNFSDPGLAGQTLYLRSWCFNNQSGIDFDLCIWEITPDPNDNCADAIELGLSDECDAQQFSLQFSTGQDVSVAPDPSCGVYQGSDIWFKFTTPASGQFAVEWANVVGSSFRAALYTGSCGSFTEVACGNSSPITFNDALLGGQELYLRVWRFANIQGGIIDLCILNTTVPPNDNCADAIPLDVEGNCVAQDFDNFNSTQEPGIAPAPSCGSISGGDVWFTFEMPGDGLARIQREGLTTGFAYLAVYQGTCGNFTEVDCLISSEEQLVIDDPALSGETLYIRMYRLGSNAGMEFSLCLQSGDCNGDFNGTALPGEPCDDGDPATGNDTWDNDCNCVGQLIDCEGIPGGSALPGTPCDDNDPSTGNDTYDNDCNCIGIPIDCNGDVGGTAFLDNCGDCVGGNTGEVACVADCNGDFGGTAFLDNCGDCVGGNTGEVACVADCNGDFGGTAFLDNCGDCVGGNTGQTACLADCNGDFGGSAFLDNCGDCVGGNTGQTACVADCNGDFGGTAFLDNCGDCVGGNTGQIACVADCNGDFGGTAFLDNCGDCVGGNTGQTACIADCNGDFGGTAFLDNCGDCVEGNTGQTACIADCNGDFGGTAFLDNCGDCVGGNTGQTSCVADCNGDFGGTAFLDNCGDCVGGNTGQTACVADCNGDFGGTAFLDNCGDCVGGNTGQTACVADCNGDFGGTAFLDQCNICVGGNTGLTPCATDCGTPDLLSVVAYPTASYTAGNLFGASEDGGTTCTLSAAGGDVFYSFEAVTKNHYLVTLIGGATSVTMGFEVTDGCGGAVLACGELALGETQTLLAEELDPGTYIVRVYTATPAPDAGSGSFLVGVQSFPVAQVQANPANFMYACNTTDRQLEEIVGASPQTGQMPSIMDYEWEIHRIGGGFSNTWQRGGPNYATKLTWLGMEYGETYNVYVRVLIDVAGVGPVWGVHQVLGGLNPEDAGASTCTIATSSSVTQTEVRPQYSPTNLQGNDYSMCNVSVAFTVADAENYEWEFDDGINPPIYYERGIGNPSVKLSWVNCLKPNTTYQVRVRANVDGQWGTFGNAQPMAMAPTANTALRANMCGTTRGLFQWLLPNPVCIADSYEYRLTNTMTGDVHTSLSTVLSGGVKLDSFSPELVPGAEYVVEVKATQCGEEGDYSSTCNITIAGPQAQGDETPAVRTMAENSATLYPNPNAGTEVRVELRGLGDGNHEVMIQIYDVYGKLIQTEGFGHAGSDMSRLVRFDGNLAMGMYMVQFVVDGERFTTEPLVVK